MEWSGKVCVVTGASSGIGRRTAVDLAELGARVCVAARREERLAALVTDLGGEPHSYRVADVADRDQVRGLVAHVEQTYGRVDVLINNAGVPGRETDFGPDSIDTYQRIMQINFFGAVNCTAEFLGLLERSAPSHVVNVTSMAGRLATPNFGSYTASKFALNGWTESLQPDLARKQIYMSSVEPGFIPTEGFPQTNLVNDPVMKRVLGTEEQVSAAIRDAIENRKPQRVVPRWYYALQIPRLLTPPVYRFVFDKVMASDIAKRASSFDEKID